MKTIFVIMMFVSVLFLLKVSNNIEEKRLTKKQDVNLIFSSILKKELTPL